MFENKIWTTKHAKISYIAKRTMHVIFFTNQCPALTAAVLKGQSVNSKFYRAAVLEVGQATVRLHGCIGYMLVANAIHLWFQ